MPWKVRPCAFLHGHGGPPGKQQLFDQQLLEMRQREMRMSEDQSSSYMFQMNPVRDQQGQLADVMNPKLFPLSDVGDQIYGQDAKSSITALKLLPQLQDKLQPVQPNLQEPNLHGYVLRL